MFSKMRLKAAEYTDERIRLVDEFLNAIKIIKLYCWWVSAIVIGEIFLKKQSNLIELWN